jgi:hypothetical protein
MDLCFFFVRLLLVFIYFVGSVSTKKMIVFSNNDGREVTISRQICPIKDTKTALLYYNFLFLDKITTSMANNLMESKDDYIPPVKLKKTTNEVWLKIRFFRN